MKGEKTDEFTSREAAEITVKERIRENGRVSLDKYWRFKSSQERQAERERLKEQHSEK